MKAIRLTAVGRPVEEREVPVRKPGPGEILIRVRAAGICRSDAHYRAGVSPVGFLPITLGHEVAGAVEEAGPDVTAPAAGARVCVHYLISCGSCPACVQGGEQFCATGRMIGKHADGGWAEYLTVPARNAIALPQAIPFAHGAVLMCAAATAFHALRKARLQPGESVAVFGVGGLGMSAVQIARALGAGTVYAVDRDPRKLTAAREAGALPLEAGAVPVEGALGTAGVDVAVDFTGAPDVQDAAVKALAPLGRLALVALTDRPLSVDTYRDLIGKEAELIGVSDHLRAEFPLLLRLAASGGLDLSRVARRLIPPSAAKVNDALDGLDQGTAEVRTVIVRE